MFGSPLDKILFLQERDGWDWYCFKCHGKGCVTGCTSCSRVYHIECLPTNYLDAATELKCPDCKASFILINSFSYNKQFF